MAKFLKGKRLPAEQANELRLEELLADTGYSNGSNYALLEGWNITDGPPNAVNLRGKYYLLGNYNFYLIMKTIKKESVDSDHTASHDCRSRFSVHLSPKTH